MKAADPWHGAFDGGNVVSSEPSVSVSVIVPVFQAADTIAACIGALEAQRPAGARVEVIVVDNDSSDGSVEWLETHSPFRLLREPRRGAYAARNTGVAAATGDIIAFIDPDCVPDGDWIAAIVEVFRDPDVLVALGVRRPAPDHGLNRLLGDYEVAKDRWMIASGQPLKYYGFTNNMAVRRGAWESFGPFIERPRGADTLFVRRVVDAAGGPAIRFVPRMHVSHLEIDGPVAYFRKAYTYGRSHRSYQRVHPSQPLSFGDRLRIVRTLVSEPGFGAVRTMALSALLGVGMACWACGSLVGAIESPADAAVRG